MCGVCVCALISAWHQSVHGSASVTLSVWQDEYNWTLWKSKGGALIDGNINLWCSDELICSIPRPPPPYALEFCCSSSSEIIQEPTVFVNSYHGETGGRALNYGHPDAQWKEYFWNFLQSSWALQPQSTEFDLCLISLFFFSLHLTPGQWQGPCAVCCSWRRRTISILANNNSASLQFARHYLDFLQNYCISKIHCREPLCSF